MIIRLLERVGAERIKESPGNVVCVCPFSRHRHARQSRRPSFGVRISPCGPSPFNCFKCGIRGRSAEDLVETFQRFGLLGSICDDSVLAEAVSQEVLMGVQQEMGWIDASLNAYSLEEEAHSQIYWPEENLEGLEPYCDYIASRGVSEDTARDWGVLFDPDDSTVLFPIRDSEGRLVGLTSRNTETGQKHNDLAFNRGRYLYGQHLFPSCRELVVVEGQFDALTVYQAGFPVVGLLSNRITADQARLIRDMGVRSVVQLLDGDNGGRTGDGHNSHLLETSYKVRVACVRLPEDADPNKIGSEAISQRLPELIQPIRNDRGVV